MKFKIGDLVELNASGKKRVWLHQAVGAVGILTSIPKVISGFNMFGGRWEEEVPWKHGAVTVRWSNLGQKVHYWDEDLDDKAIPVNCLKKVRKKKK